MLWPAPSVYCIGAVMAGFSSLREQHAAVVNDVKDFLLAGGRASLMRSR